MLVFKIASDGPAAKSDLAPGDIITKKDIIEMGHGGLLS